MRWNSPPNWPPPPPGWTPPPGWQPDPAWGPPPPGHQFWVADQPAPSTQPMPQMGYQPGVHQPGMQQPGGSGRGKVWLVVSLVVVLVLALGGVLALTVFSGDEDDGSPAATSSGDPTDEPTDEPSSEEPSASAPTETSEEPSGDTPGGLLPIGESAEVGDYVVTVDAVQLDADDVIAETNEFNEAPKGQYVLVDLTAVYEGSKTGTAWLELQPQYVDAAGTEHLAYECTAVVPSPGFDLPAMQSGDSGSYQVCFDVPADQVDGGHIVVSDTYDFEDEGVGWAIE